MALTNYDLALTIFNLTGSLLSTFGSAFIILCYCFIPMKRHIRHFLIMNLAISDIGNHLDVSISGIVVLVNNRPLTSSALCVLNGFICQLSVLATDCNILAIAVITLVAIRSHRWQNLREGLKTRYTLYACGAAWVLPLITALVTLGKGWYGPVSGNWCWIKADPAYVRYVMTHGWRLSFIIIEIVIYCYIYRYVKRELGTPVQGRISVHMSTAPNSAASVTCTHGPVIFITRPHPMQDEPNPSNHSAAGASSEELPPMASAAKRWSITSDLTVTDPTPSLTAPEASPKHQQIEWTAPTSQDADTSSWDPKSVHRMLLLNAYPIAYIILWIPGVANRLSEAAGHPNKVLRMMQATTQFVGFANAVTYGWNEKVAVSLKQWWMNKV